MPAGISCATSTSGDSGDLISVEFLIRHAPLQEEQKAKMVCCSPKKETKMKNQRCPCCSYRLGTLKCRQGLRPGQVCEDVMALPGPPCFTIFQMYGLHLGVHNKFNFTFWTLYAPSKYQPSLTGCTTAVERHDFSWRSNNQRIWKTHLQTPMLESWVPKLLQVIREFVYIAILQRATQVTAKH